MNRSLQVLGVMPGLVHELDEDDERLVLQRDVRVRVDVIQDLAEVIHLRGQRPWVGAHTTFSKAPAEPPGGGRRVVEGIGPVGAIQLNRAEEHENAAL